MKIGIHNIRGGRWKIFREAIPGNTYVIGADAAKGVEGGNSSALTILCVNDGRQEAVCAGIIDPTDFAIECEKGGYLYNEAELGIEFEKHGATIINYLKEKQYPKIFFHTQKLVSMDDQNPSEWGWNPTYYRQTAIDWLVQDMAWTISKKPEENKKALWVYDPDTVLQCSYFGRNKKTGKFGAVKGKLDDKVTALYVSNFIRRLRLATVHAPPPAPPKELTFLEKLAMNREKRDDRDMGPRYDNY